ncbi:hypothetical protein FC18_GL001675 [Lacticaseibacillus sharpeae JCM 1186 = DSM 20505]|uniref:Uncharacterized protein n=1 Tax=Lacticaseibacillus sharpeae JCM 1186 = DSM 20505 TaxID=1291052 RepID=A0A0R1ZKU2_9LACO|nr:hypothetical protein FC18_GL001675 [Lacticaseibacillus sharpeae JCM 1186 = DSM 20505]
MDNNRNSDVHSLNSCFDELLAKFVATHVLSSAHRGLDKNRNVLFLSSTKDSASPFEVVGVECTNCVVTLTSRCKQFSTMY